MTIGGKPMPEPVVTASDAAIDSMKEDKLVSANGDSAKWAFSPIVAPKVPAPKLAAWIRNPIDAFVPPNMAGWICPSTKSI